MIPGSRKYIQTVTLAGIITVLFGCNANNAIDRNTTISRRITEIIISEDIDWWYCTIKGDQRLIFTAINQVSPTGVLLHFPDTNLDLLKAAQIHPGNEIIDTIEANEIVVDRTTTARIMIELKVERPYGLSPDETGLKVSFPKTVRLTHEGGEQKDWPDKDKQSKLASNRVSGANYLTKITPSSYKSNIIVNLEADGIIQDYNSFAIENPARIVFDLYNLKSPYKTEQTIAVESKWVKQIRYFPYSDKIRLVLDTHDRFLTKYSSFPVDSGLIIYIGQSF